MISLRAVDPIGVYNRWDWFRAGIDHAIRKTDAHMRSEDAYLRIRAGSAFAYVIQADAEDIGFVILTQEADPDGPVLFIWCLWCERGKLKPHRFGFYEELDKIAAGIKAKRIRAQSPRLGYMGYEYVKAVATVYEKEMGV